MASSSTRKCETDKSLYHLAENMAYTVCSNPKIFFNSTNNLQKGSVREKLLYLYFQQFSQHPQTNFATNPQACPNLLSKLLDREKLNTLVIHLKSIDEGYSICLKSASSTFIETANMPYTDSELLNFIEQEELPHNLIDLLEQVQPDLFYDGCIIAELRDSRRAVKGAYKTSYILLKPSQRSLLADINSLTSGQFRWSQDDRLALESQLLLATSDPLCLAPTPAVNLLHNRLVFKKKVALTEEIRRAMRPYSTKDILRRKAFANVSCNVELPIMAFLEQRGDKSKYPYSRDSHIKTPVVDSWKRVPVELGLVLDTEVQMLAKTCVPKSQSGDCTPVVVEEYAIETERPVGRIHRSHLVILKKSSDEKFFGELHIDRSDNDTSKCTFELGTAPLKDKYISQFIDIFTEEGRRQVKITHTKPGQPSSVTYTSGPCNSENIAPKSGNSQLRFSAAVQTSKQSSFRFSGDSQQTTQISSASLSADPVSCFTVDSQPSIKFSLTSQSGSYSLATTDDRSMSSEVGGSSLTFGRQSLKIQGSMPPSSETSQSEPMASPDEQSSIKEQFGLSSHLRSPPPFTSSCKQLADSLSKTTFIVSKGGTKTLGAGPMAELTAKSVTRNPVVQLSVSTQGSKHIAQLPASTNSGTPVSIHNISGLQTVHGLQNVQVSLTSLAQGGIAVPVSLLSSMSASQPIFFPLNMMENSSNNQQAVSLSQSTSTSGARPIVVTAQAGATQQILGGHQGLITLPVGSSLAQQLLAANKRQQITNTQQVSNQQGSTQLISNQQGPQQTSQITSNRKQSNVQIGQLLGSQQMPIQIGHVPTNQQSSNMHATHQIVTQNPGSLQTRPTVTTTRPSSLQVFQQPSVVSTPQINSSQINIVTTQTAGSAAPQILHIPQNLAFAQPAPQAILSAAGAGRTSSGQQIRLAVPSQPTRLPVSGQTRFPIASQHSQKILFRQLGSPEELQSTQANT